MKSFNFRLTALLCKGRLCFCLFLFIYPSLCLLISLLVPICVFPPASLRVFLIPYMLYVSVCVLLYFSACLSSCQFVVCRETLVFRRLYISRAVYFTNFTDKPSITKLIFSEINSLPNPLHKMTRYKYFKSVYSALPNPNTSLSGQMPSKAISSTNREMSGFFHQDTEQNNKQQKAFFLHDEPILIQYGCMWWMMSKYSIVKA